ncbi:MAG TPA: FHA domain-containing serine/threonine-protein kinase [Vicinamibacterales bacterium]|nr:FHA domain-containing serine/threonine-protein kinase [Vicinamibacterales bacterium]
MSDGGVEMDAIARTHRPPAAEHPLADLADALLDGTGMDWADFESSLDESDRPQHDGCRSAAPWLPSSDAAGLEETPPAADAFADRTRPETWGSLRLIDRLGQGAFGDVYRAWDQNLDRVVALKLMPATNAAVEPAASFVREGRLLARVRHPNVVTIFGAEHLGDMAGLWMEFVHGRTLGELLDSRGTFSAAEATEICLDLCGALSAVHSAGLLHGDVKPHNVMRSEDGRMVLMDFGSGCELGDPSARSGTPLYLAPEIFREEPATIRADIYSLGVLLFHLVTGEYPVTGESLSELRRAHQTGSRRAVTSLRPDLHPTLARVIERAIDPVPERRYPDADALAADVRVRNADAVAADWRAVQRRPGWSAGLEGVEPSRPVRRARYSLEWMESHLPLFEGDNIAGRDRGLQVPLDATSVSRQHCLIRVAGAQVTIEDLGSKNGTYVRDERVTNAVAVTAGERIRLGSLVLTLRLNDEVPTATHTTSRDR